MPSIDRIHRLLRLVELLQSGRVYNSRELADQCDVSRRTVFRDLNTLQESGVRVFFDEERQGYRLPSRTFLPPTDFSLDEALSLLVLCHEMGSDQHGVPFHRPARTAALKLLSNLPRHLGEHAGELTESIDVRLGPHNPLDNAKPHYEMLMQALPERRKVRIRYESLTEWKQITTLLNPYRMVFHRRSWYVIGRSSLHRSVRTFNVARIRKAELVDSRYRIPQGFSLERYLGNAWSLIRERGRRRQVVIRFQKMVAYNVAEVQWHRTQKIVWNDDGSIEFHVTVDGLSEILWWILGYGDQAEVLEPPELRAEVKRRAESLAAIYARPQPSVVQRRSAKPRRRPKRKR